jgi:type II secretory pathway pseudopilin PulG
MSLKEELLKKERPTVDFPIQVKDATKAQAKLTALQNQLRMLQSAGKETGEVEKQLKSAVRAVKRCYKTLKLRALTPAEFEDLVYLHPPTPEQVEGKNIDDVPLWNEDVFRPALISRTVINAGMNEDDWAEVLPNLNDGEYRLLWSTVLSLNTLPRQMPSNLPKD